MTHDQKMIQMNRLTQARNDAAHAVVGAARAVAGGSARPVDMQWAIDAYDAASKKIADFLASDDWNSASTSVS